MSQFKVNSLEYEDYGEGVRRMRIGVIGLGYWGPNLVRNVQASPHAELAAICDRDNSVLDNVAQKYPEADRIQEAETLWARSDIDAVIIATPSGMHFEHAMAALDSGKHVFVEKPLAGSSDEAKTLVELAEDAQKVLMVGHTFLYNEVVQEIKSRIDSGELGDLYYGYGQRLNLGRFRQDSDVLWTLAPHDVSILNYWFESKPVRVSCRGMSHVFQEKDIADVCFCLLEYPQATKVHLHLSWLDPHKVRRMVLVGKQKMLVYDDTKPGKQIQLFDKGVRKESQEGPARDYADFRARLHSGDIVIPNVQQREPLAVEVDHFVECIREEREPLSGPKNGMEVMCVLQALSKSMQQSGELTKVDYGIIPADMSND